MYDNLPVYKAAYDLFIEITSLRSKMKREYKFTIGERLMNAALDLIINIYRANKR